MPRIAVGDVELGYDRFGTGEPVLLVCGTLGGRTPGRLGQFRADADCGDRSEDLAEIRVPSMVIGFELDVLTPAPLCREVAEAIPGCRYVEIPACGHAGPSRSRTR